MACGEVVYSFLVDERYVNVDVLGLNTYLRDHVATKVLAEEHGREDKDDPFFVANLGRLLEVYERWLKALPRVQPYYAVKANSDPVLLKILSSLGVGFDCCSKNEIESVLSTGALPDRIVYANPVKHVSHLQHALKRGVDLTVFDSERELYKIKEHHPSARLLVRLCCDDPSALHQLGEMIGCSLPEAFKLLHKAQELGLCVIGVCFHIGSQSQDPHIYNLALEMSAKVFEQAEGCGFTFSILDIGGGFPGVSGSDELFYQMAAVICRSLDVYFHSSKYPQLQVIAEPGRYFCSSLYTLALSVIAKKEMVRDDYDSDLPQPFIYFMSDGRNGSLRWYRETDEFNKPKLLRNEASMTLHLSTLHGPTLDPADVFARNLFLPELEVGDWLFMENMGDYHNDGASKFCGFGWRKIYYYVSVERSEEVQKLCIM